MATEASTLKEKFGQALRTLEEAKPFAKSMYQTEVFQLATELAGTDEGLAMLYDYAADLTKPVYSTVGHGRKRRTWSRHLSADRFTSKGSTQWLN